MSNLRVPRERVAELCLRLIEELNDDTGKGGINELSTLTGLSQRVLYRVINGPSPSERKEREVHQSNGQTRVKKGATGTYVEFRTLDKILAGAGLPHLTQYPPEKGGFADIYDRLLERNKDG